MYSSTQPGPGTVNSYGTQQQSSTTTTQETSSDAPAEFVTVTGTVQSYDAGRSITIVKPDGSQVTYTVNAQSMVPEKLATGKTVTVRTTKVTTGQPVVQRVTYSTTTTTTTRTKS